MTKQCWQIGLFFFSVYFILTTSAYAETFADGMVAYQAKDYKSAFNIWQKLASTGNSYAQFNIAYMYEFGIEVEQNYKKAVTWYQKAANQGHVRAQNFLGWMYETGKGVKQNRREALRWLQKAANYGNKEAIADYKRVSKRFARAQDKRYCDQLLKVLIDELANAQKRYNKTNFPTQLDAANHVT